jgi:hypothetical protein
MQQQQLEIQECSATIKLSDQHNYYHLASSHILFVLAVPASLLGIKPSLGVA